MRKYGFWLILLVWTTSYAPCRAETLDDDSIRKIYEEAKAAVHDPVKSQNVMEARLDDNFTLRSKMTRVAGSNPPQKATATKSKSQAIEAEINGMKDMHIDDYDNSITSIQYSPDRKTAYVNDTSSSAGTVNLPAQDTQSGQVRYSARETCADTLSLVSGIIKIMQSDCDDEIAIGK